MQLPDKAVRPNSSPTHQVRFQILGPQMHVLKAAISGFHLSNHNFTSLSLKLEGSSSSSGGQSLMTTTQNAALTKSDKVLHEGAVVVTVTAAQEKDRREDVGEEVGAELHSPGMREEE